MRFNLHGDGYVKLEIEGRLRQASFCSVGSFEEHDDDNNEAFCEAAENRKDAPSFSSDLSSSEQLVKRKRKRTLKNLGESLSKRTRNFGSAVFGFFRLRGLFGRLKRRRHYRNMDDKEVLFS